MSDDDLLALHVVSSNALAGIERHALALISALRDRGCDARLLCRSDAAVLAGAATRQGVPLAGAAALLRARGVVHVHDGQAALAGALLTPQRAVRVRTQHFIATASSARSGPAGHLSLQTHRLINQRYRGQVMVSESVLAAATQRRELGRAQVRVIGAGITAPGERAIAEAAAWRHGHRHPVLISAGRMEAERRCEVLIQAMAQLLVQIPDCRLIMAGDGPERPRLQALAVELGVAAAIDWPGWLADLGAALGRAHVYVNTWPLEAFGIATAEAMSYGLVPVVPDAGAAGELIEPSISGVQYAAGDPAGLAVVLADLLSHPERRESLSAGAVTRARRFGMDGVADAMLAFYRALAG